MSRRGSGKVPLPLTSISELSPEVQHWSLSLSLHLSLSLSPSHTSKWSCTHGPRKTTTPQLISCFHTTSASFLFQSDKIPMTFTPSSPPLPSSSVCTSPSSCPPLRPALFCGFPCSFFRSVFLALIGIALFEMEKLFTLTAQAFGWRSYPEPLVMLLETWHQ